MCPLGHCFNSRAHYFLKLSKIAVEVKVNNCKKMIPNMSNKYLSQYHETTLKLKKSVKNERKKLETFFECILQYVLTFNM